MERYHNHNGWNVWVNPLWNTLLSNPAYYYYYTAKAALMNQSVMVRKRGNSNVPKRPAPIPTPAPPPPSLPFGALGVVGNGINSALKRYGIEECPQCKLSFNGSNCRPVQDSCGHFKCRPCFISNEDGCPQCQKSPAGKGSSRRAITSGHGNNPSCTNGISSSMEDHSMHDSSTDQQQINAHQNSNVNHEPYSSEAKSSFISSTIELNSVPELGSSGIDPIYSNNPLLKSEYSGLTDFSIHENGLLHSTSYSSIINQESEFSKSLMSLRTDLPNNEISSSPSKSGVKLRENSYVEPSEKKKKSNPGIIHDKITVIEGNSRKPKMTYGRSSFARSKEACKSSTAQDENTSFSIQSLAFPNANVDSHSEDPQTSKASTSSTSLVTVTSGPSGNLRKSFKGADYTTGVFNGTVGHLDNPATGTSMNSSPSKSGVKINEDSGAEPSEKKKKLNPVIVQNRINVKAGSIRKPKITYGKSSFLKSKEASKCTTAQDEKTSSSIQSLAFPNENLDSHTEDSQTSKASTSFPVSLGPSESFSAVEQTTVVAGSVSNEAVGTSSPSKSGVKVKDGGSEPREKKKKKRNPVIIHDHITVIAGEPTMFQCNVCMKKFKTKAHIKYHEFCQNGEKPFKCEQCGQGFIAKSHYEYHLRTHTGERPYVCPKCGKGFNQRGKVTRHMRSHTGEKPFICVECGRGFANAQALRSHHLIHTGERPFACKFCQKRFTGMTNLKKHIITHTGERPYVCTHCGKSFGLKWTLDLHLRTHSSERPYACDQCSRAFSNSKDLRRHLVIHSGERPFKCWICGTAFRRKDNLDRHIKNTHNQPKEVAKQLANEAAAEYLAQSKQAPVPVSKVNSAVISNVIKTAQFPKANKLIEASSINGTRQIMRGPSGSVHSRESSESTVIITAQLSPRVGSHDSESYESYILPDGGGSPLAFHLQDNEDDKGKIEGLTLWESSELQTVDIVQFKGILINAEESIDPSSDLSENSNNEIPEITKVNCSESETERINSFQSDTVEYTIKSEIINSTRIIYDNMETEIIIENQSEKCSSPSKEPNPEIPELTEVKIFESETSDLIKSDIDEYIIQSEITSTARTIDDVNFPNIIGSIPEKYSDPSEKSSSTTTESTDIKSSESETERIDSFQSETAEYIIKSEIINSVRMIDSNKSETEDIENQSEQFSSPPTESNPEILATEAKISESETTDPIQFDTHEDTIQSEIINSARTIDYDSTETENIENQSEQCSSPSTESNPETPPTEAKISESETADPIQSDTEEDKIQSEIINSARTIDYDNTETENIENQTEQCSSPSTESNPEIQPTEAKISESETADPIQFDAEEDMIQSEIINSARTIDYDNTQTENIENQTEQCSSPSTESNPEIQPTEAKISESETTDPIQFDTEEDMIQSEIINSVRITDSNKLETEDIENQSDQCSSPSTESNPEIPPTEAKISESETTDPIQSDTEEDMIQSEIINSVRITDYNNTETENIENQSEQCSSLSTESNPEIPPTEAKISESETTDPIQFHTEEDMIQSEIINSARTICDGNTGPELIIENEFKKCSETSEISELASLDKLESSELQTVDVVRFKGILVNAKESIDPCSDLSENSNKEIPEITKVNGLESETERTDFFKSDTIEYTIISEIVNSVRTIDYDNTETKIIIENQSENCSSPSKESNPEAKIFESETTDPIKSDTEEDMIQSEIINSVGTIGDGNTGPELIIENEFKKCSETSEISEPPASMNKLDSEEYKNSSDIPSNTTLSQPDFQDSCSLSSISSSESFYEEIITTQEASQQTDPDFLGDEDGNCKILFGRPVSILLGTVNIESGNTITQEFTQVNISEHDINDGTAAQVQSDYSDYLNTNPLEISMSPTKDNNLDVESEGINLDLLNTDGPEVSRSTFETGNSETGESQPINLVSDYTQEKYTESINPNQEFYENNGLRFYQTQFEAQHYKPSDLRIVYTNDEMQNHVEKNEIDSRNMNVVYATATATAVRNDDEFGPPLKVRLLYAEALGVSGDGENNQQFIYTSTAPDQEVDRNSPLVQLAPPVAINLSNEQDAPPTINRLEYLYAPPNSQSENYPHSSYSQNYNYQSGRHSSLPQQSPSRYPIKRYYEGGIAHVQTGSNYPSNQELVERVRKACHLIPPESNPYPCHQFSQNVPDAFHSKIFAPYPVAVPTSQLQHPIDSSRQYSFETDPLKRLASLAATRLAREQAQQAEEQRHKQEVQMRKQAEEQIRKEREQMFKEKAEQLRRQAEQEMLLQYGGPSNPQNFEELMQVRDEYYTKEHRRLELRESNFRKTGVISVDPELEKEAMNAAIRAAAAIATVGEAARMKREEQKQARQRQLDSRRVNHGPRKNYLYDHSHEQD